MRHGVLLLTALVLILGGLAAIPAGAVDPVYEVEFDTRTVSGGGDYTIVGTAVGNSTSAEGEFIYERQEWPSPPLVETTTVRIYDLQCLVVEPSTNLSYDADFNVMAIGRLDIVVDPSGRFTGDDWAYVAFAPDEERFSGQRPLGIRTHISEPPCDPWGYNNWVDPAEPSGYQIYPGMTWTGNGYLTSGFVTVEEVVDVPHASTATIALALDSGAHVFGEAWAPGTTVTVTIDDPANGVGVDYSDDFVTNGDGQFGSPQGVWPIEPGFVVVATDGLVTKEHTVLDLTVDIDPVTDIISGTAGIPGDEIGVIAEHPILGMHNENVVADPVTGAYISHVTIDLRDGTMGGVLEWDNDGDSTRSHFNLHSPGDFDFDGIGNEVDNCPYVVNFGQEDTDGDGAGDVCDAVNLVDTNGHWAVDSIEVIYTLGITKGCNPPVNDRYCPDANVTRGQMAAFLTRALGLTERLDNPFVDDDDSIFEADIERLAAAGITKGCNPPTNDRFCPDGTVTRGQMAAFLVRALKYTDDGGGDLFVDDDDSVFESDIDRLGTAGVTRGCNPPINDRFCPRQQVTRAQMAVFLHRALG